MTTAQPPFAHLLGEILAAAKARGITQRELAKRAGIAPETLSRMKRRGEGDLGVLDTMARIVGLRLSLVPDDDKLEALRRGDFFDD